jgi:hypothetical protein
MPLTLESRQRSEASLDTTVYTKLGNIRDEGGLKCLGNPNLCTTVQLSGASKKSYKIIHY